MIGLVLAVMAGAPGAIAQDSTSTVLSREDARNFANLAQQKIAAKKEQLSKLSKQEITDALKANLRDKTKIIYQQGYGVFVEYSAADGRDRMWFPGNRGVVIGCWGLRDFGEKTRACFKYFNSRNAVTGEFENTECIPPEQTLSGGNVIDEKSGDAFNLLSDKIPYRKDAMSIPAWPVANNTSASQDGAK
jgi:hypothetical protein